MTIVVLFGSLFLLILLSMPIGISIGISTVITIIFAADNVQITTFSQKAFTALDSFPLMAIPFFTLAGVLMGKGGVAKRLLDFAQSLVGFVTGGLAIVTVLACMFFAAISGSGPATVAAVGSFMIPAMKEKNYGSGFASAITAAAGSMGAIIPPSISFILLGVAGGLSISSLFLAGVIPGILIGVLLMVASYFMVKRKKDVEPSDYAKFSIKDVWNSFRKSIWAILTPLIVLGGIYAGIFTPTEASAVAVGYAVIVGVFIYKELRLKDIYDSLVETLKITGAILFMVGLSLAFAYLLTVERIPVTIAEYMVEISDNPIMILIMINIFLLVIGAFIDVVASIVILTPILLPVATQLGVDPIHFGVIMIVNLTIGYITPPVGVNLFVASSVGKTPFEVVVKAALPIFAVMLVALALITFIPQLSLMLPSLFN
ncbi:TRAP transporter large permease [Virgibacillus sp. W0181]|uniref:TRAP transporter large permease n=1 Tax=Virgibacillus sp. W0181 TaxID=3391581 RepID=UPI003F465789